MREQKCTAIPPLKQKKEECIILQAPAEASTNMVLTKNFPIPNDTELINGFRDKAPAEASTNMVLTKNFPIPNDTELINGFRDNNRDPSFWLCF
jgi:hypothetical protein